MCPVCPGDEEVFTAVLAVAGAVLSVVGVVVAVGFKVPVKMHEQFKL